MSAQELPQTAATSAARLTEEQRCDLEVKGFVVLPGILSQEECDRLSYELDKAWEASERRLFENGVKFLGNALLYSPLFEKCAVEPTVLAAVRSVLGPDIRLNHMNGRRPEPGSGLQPLHHFTRRRGPPFDKCGTIWCLDEFTELNGSPRFLPGSHLSEEPFLSRCVDPLLPHPDEVHGVAPRGSVVVHNSHIIHGGTLNQSDRSRRSVLSGFTTTSAAANYKAKYPVQELPASIQQELSSECLQLIGLL